MRAHPARHLPALLLLLLLAPQPAAAGTLSYIGHDRWVNVATVFDGDTFRTADGEKIRLLGINTPEIAHNDQPGEPLGDRARLALQSEIGGKLVRLSFDAERRDRYGRLLAHIWLADGTWVNAWLVRQGLAHVYTFAPNFKRTRALLDAEREARRQRLGIWSTDRFRIVDARHIDGEFAGQFRLVAGPVERIDRNRWGFRMGGLNVSIPRKYRPLFGIPPKLSHGEQVVARGVIRISTRGELYLALHTPFDLEKIEQ